RRGVPGPGRVLRGLPGPHLRGRRVRVPGGVRRDRPLRAGADPGRGALSFDPIRSSPIPAGPARRLLAPPTPADVPDTAPPTENFFNDYAILQILSYSD